MHETCERKFLLNYISDKRILININSSMIATGEIHYLRDACRIFSKLIAKISIWLH